MHRLEVEGCGAVLTSHVPEEYLQFKTTKRLISKIQSGLDFGANSSEKSGSEQGEQNSGLSRFHRFSSRYPKTRGRRPILPESTPPSGDFELLSISILRFTSNLCKLEKIKGHYPPLSELSQYLPSILITAGCKSMLI